MSNNQARARATEQPVRDALLNLVRVEIPQELQRMRKQDPSVASLQAEMTGTLGSLVKSIGDYVLEMRDWMTEMHTIQADHIEALDARIDMIEDFGGETQLLPADAELLGKIVFACKHLASEMIKGPVPERDEAGKQKLAEIIVLCEQAEKLVTDSVLTYDEDLSDDDGESVAVDEPN